MDILSIILLGTGSVIFGGGVFSLVSHSRYQERNRRLPDACKYLDLKQKNESLRSENLQLTEENNDLAGIIEKAEEDKKWLADNTPKLLSLKEDRRLQEELKAENKDILEQISRLAPQLQQQRKEHEILSAQNETAKEKLNHSEADICRLTECVDKMRSEKAELEARNASLQKENETRAVENEAATRKLRELQDTIAAEDDQLTNIRAEYTEKNNALEKTENQLNNFSDQLSLAKTQLGQVKEQIQLQEEHKTELDKTVGNLNAEQTRLEQSRTALRQEKTELEVKIRQSQEAYDSLLADYQEKTVSYETLKAQNEIAQQTKDELEAKSTRLTECVDKMRSEKAELEARNASLQKENETRAVENEAATRKLRELQDTIAAEDDQLTNIRAEYEVKKADIDSYQTRKDALQKEIDILQTSLQNLRKEIGGKNNVNEETLKDLWQPIIFPALPPAIKEKSENDLLADTQEYIRGKKLYFPNRVLHAFHTSMKCNDISPLTVLAGISGTGKSELPKCYAEGMGIHFAMLAVQPRWDSPQDLLGFFNYMENKYKATELARAIVRFDRFNRQSWGTVPEACDDRSDRMLLVLLDEMNLARVEYYFSEFLSKLETRRGVNPADINDRVKAEIELELTGHTPLRLFPDRNILFTGTMNEDESTQTLSDKVLDRANVLRFGKPKSADISRKTFNCPQRAPRSEGLTYKNWQKWCRDAKDVQMDEEVSGWINRLNDAMEAVQKPFGHRVAQAIAAYIANYPKGIANGKEKKLAFADQIEQRILPKLRGLELEIYDEPLKKIGELILETGDEILYAAYNKGCQAEANGIFLWQGVDRSEEA